MFGAARVATNHMGGGGAGGSAPAGGWNLTGASYDSKFFTFTSESASNASGIRLKDDGTKMYILSDATDKVFQYSLSTAWDISSASYDTKSFTVTTQESGPDGFFFGDSGTKMYIVGYSNATVYQYTLGTAWDVSTASYASKSKSVSAQVATPTDVHFRDNGLSMYVAHRNSGVAMEVYQYTLSTAWDVSTATYATKSFTDSTRDTNLRGFFIGNGGTKLFMVGDVSNDIFSYTLGTAWDISTASYDSKSFALDSQITGPWGFDIKPDGLKLYALGYSVTTAYQYSLT